MISTDIQKNPAPMPPIRAQLSLIADNLLNALDQVTRVEDAVHNLPNATGGGPMPSPNTLQELVNIINDRVLSVANRLGRVADKL
jgi:hypothetical protein